MDENLLKFDLSLSLPGFTLRSEGEIQNEICGVFGASASGKSTLAKILLGFYPAAEGKISFGGQLWQDFGKKKWLAPHKRGIGYVAQQGLLYPHLNVKRNIEAAAKGRKPGIKKWKFEEICDWLKLEPLFFKMPATLSGGERQRVALGRCLNSQPGFIILDEPLASLDHSYRDSLLDIVSKTLKSARIPTLYISHSPREIAVLCRSMYLMESGRLSGKGNPINLLNRSRAFANGSQNFLKGRLKKQLDSDLLFSDRNEEVVLRISPFPHWENYINSDRELVVNISGQDVMLATKFPSGLSARNIIPASLLKLENTTYGQCAHCQIGKKGWNIKVDITVEASRELQLISGMDLFIIIKANSISPSE